jgi:hypothetical protein
MKNGFVAVLSGFLLTLSVLPVASQELCADGSEPTMRVAGSNTHSYEGAAKHIGQPEAAALGFTGQGTSTAFVEKLALAWFFRFDDGRPPPFGACIKPENAAPDHWGWAPEQDPNYPEYPCMIAWVMCIAATADAGIPHAVDEKNASRGLQKCEAPVNAIGTKSGNQYIHTGGHATSIGLGYAKIAPGSKIISIAVPDTSSVSFRAAFRWLYTPGTGYAADWQGVVNNNQIFLKDDSSAASQAWRANWQQVFGNESPAKKFGTVAASLDWLVFNGGFTEACGVTNPEVPQIDTDGDRFIDIADNCINIKNVQRRNIGTDEEPFWTAQLPDSDGDGYGNLCDADFDNDMDTDWDDVKIFNDIRFNFDTFEPPLDLNNDGKKDQIDAEMFRKAADFNANGIIGWWDVEHMAQRRMGRPPGPAAKDINPLYDDVRKPYKYVQDRLHSRGWIQGQNNSRYEDFSHEFAGLRANGILPVVGTGNHGYTNGVRYPACLTDAFKVGGIEHHIDRLVAYGYDAESNEYITDDVWSMHANASPTMPVLVAHGLGKTWLPLEPPPNAREPVLGCDNDAMQRGGFATSHTPSVAAGAVAVLRSPGAYPGASLADIENLLMQTDRRALVRRDCTFVKAILVDPYNPTDDEVFCSDEVPSLPGTNRRVVYSKPVLDLSGALRTAKRLQLSSASVDPDIADTDNDGIYDKFDNCIEISNPHQRDSDADGYGNACDADYDNNGIVDWPDGAKFVAEYMDTDSVYGDFDQDGDSDADDYNFMLTTLAYKPPGPSGLDRDGDGIANNLDNCVYTSNGPWTVFAGQAVYERNQLDLDNDQFGNLCDGDINNDGVVDLTDAEILTNRVNRGEYTPAADFNGDGVTDHVDKDYFIENLFEWSADVIPGPSGLCNYSNVELAPDGCQYN